LGLQLQSLNVGTAALPRLQIPTSLPPRWAQDTPSAIMSGVLHSSIASLQSFIQDWHQQFPDSPVLVTGGDGGLLQSYLQKRQVTIIYVKDLVFLGIAKL
jgi:type III pantothenate kinase